MVAVKVSELEAGPALDWAVGKAMGWSLKTTYSMMSPQDGWGRSLPGESFRLADAWPVWHDETGQPSKWPRLFKIQSHEWTPSSDDRFLGRLIALFELDISRAGNIWKVFADHKSNLAQQDEFLPVAACRAVVESRLGGVINVPDNPLHSG